MANEVSNIGQPKHPYTIAEPHPAYGKDPNIANEYGHTYFPKFVVIDGKSHVVNDEKEENELLGRIAATPSGKDKKPVGWGKS